MNSCHTKDSLQNLGDQRKNSADGSVCSYRLAVENNVGQKLEDDDQQESLKPAQTRRQILIGVSFVMAIAVCTATATQFGKDLYTDGNFTSASLVAWSSRSMGIFIYPLVSFFLAYRGQSHRETYRRASKIFGSSKSRIAPGLLKLLPLTILSTCATYLSFYALRYTSSTDVTAVFSASAAIVYVLSVFILKEPFIALRFCAVLISVAGVVVIIYSEGFGSFGALGITLAVGSSCCAALYRVLTKVAVGETSLIRASFFLSVTCAQALLIFWIPILILYLTDTEIIIPASFPWTEFFLAIFILFLYSVLMILCINFTYPIYMSMGPLFGIPLNAAIDVIIRNQTFSSIKIIGTLLLIIGFLVLTIPIPYVVALSGKIKLLLCKKHK